MRKMSIKSQSLTRREFSIHFAQQSIFYLLHIKKRRWSVTLTLMAVLGSFISHISYVFQHFQRVVVWKWGKTLQKEISYVVLDIKHLYEALKSCFKWQTNTKLLKSAVNWFSPAAVSVSALLHGHLLWSYVKNVEYDIYMDGINRIPSLNIHELLLNQWMVCVNCLRPL